MAELVGQIPLFANDIEVGNVTSVSVTLQKPQKTVKYMNKRAERVSGVADFAWNITTSSRAQRQEILDIIGGPLAEGFSLTFVIGEQRYKLLDCGLACGTDDATITLAGVSPELIEVSLGECDCTWPTSVAQRARLRLREFLPSLFMDLGNILAREGNTPLTGRIVKLTIQGQSEGVLVSALASARLIPITADEQRTVRSEAVAFVYAVDEDGKRLRPKLGAEDVEEEFVWRFLARVLRDEEDVKKPFATATRLRQCLIVQQVEYLQREYDLMLADHYPELLGLIPTGNRDEIVRAATRPF